MIVDASSLAVMLLSIIQLAARRATHLMRQRIVTLLAVILVCLAAHSSFSQAPGTYKGKDEKLPLAVAPQPLPFSHQQHVSKGMSCLVCHENADKKERAGIPDTAKCMVCHETIATDSPAIEKLTQIHRQGGKVSWVRVYQVPDFVFFSHSLHVRAGLDCATCHGPVQQREVLAKEVSTSMIACMNCHAGKGASLECHTCHELGQ
jgi:5-methylcytosine-specific restriction endonuclease McrA